MQRYTFVLYVDCVVVTDVVVGLAVLHAPQSLVQVEQVSGFLQIPSPHEGQSAGHCFSLPNCSISAQTLSAQITLQEEVTASHVYPVPNIFVQEQSAIEFTQVSATTASHFPSFN